MSAPGGAPISNKLSPADVSRLKAAIEAAETVDEITRLERVLLTGRMNDVADLLRREAGKGDVLSSLWVDEKSTKSTKKRPAEALEPNASRLVTPPLAIPKPKRIRHPAVAAMQAKSYEIPENVLTCLHTRLLIRARLSGSARGLEPLIDPDADAKSWPSTRGLERDTPAIGQATEPSSPTRRRDVIAISVGMCSTLDPSDGRTLGREVCRVVVRDYAQPNKVILDLKVKPLGAVADIRPTHTGIEAITDDDDSLTLSAARHKVMNLMHSGTIILCMTMLPARALEIRHECWLPMTHLFEIDASKFNKDDAYIKLPLTHDQLRQAVLGDAKLGTRHKDHTITDPLLAESTDVINIVEGCVAVELGKQANEQNAPDDEKALELSHALKIGPPLREREIAVEHIPSEWRDAELSALFPDASAIHTVTWELQQPTPQGELEWRGNCVVEFASVNLRNKHYNNLNGCTDVFVGYDWEVAEEVTEDVLKQVASEFGVVNHVRIPGKFRPPIKRDDKSRPFGFVSFADREDAVKMGRKKSLRASVTGPGGRVVLLRPKLGKHQSGPLKRVPVEIGDYIELHKT
ncbi:hypothetical protein FOL47_006621 [Perkinsus chesapeaki]|uniref:RRM domain-containing protein n=1 Tax=Perkinsus chesapeaki TaxID=330153 RepID=A0A7J6LQW5_PERCH|nr:hypothetical protein FOL47_006621 [Perkinsus chesapeaki]